MVMAKTAKTKQRCHWAQKPAMIEYHDKEWGRAGPR